jgi:geranylgeranyl pyrophosphate synthase
MLAAKLTQEALDALETFGEKAQLMRAIAESMLAREY